MAEGTFGDNIAGFLQGLTGEILKRKDEERALKQRDEDIQLQTGLNLFNEMMSNPDKYDDTSIRLFADMLGKNHRLEKVIGQPIQSAISPMLAERAKAYEQFSQNKNLKSLVGDNLPSYSPAELKKYAPMAAQMDMESRQRAADLEYKTQQELARSDAETARQKNEYAMRSLSQEKADAADIEREKIRAQAQKDVAGIRSSTDIQEANIRQSQMEGKMEQAFRDAAMRAASKRLEMDKKNMLFGQSLSPEEEARKFNEYFNQSYAHLRGLPYEIPEEKGDPLVSRAEDILGTLSSPTTTVTSSPTTTTNFPRRKAGYSGPTYSK